MNMATSNCTLFGNACYWVLRSYKHLKKDSQLLKCYSLFMNSTKQRTCIQNTAGDSHVQIKYREFTKLDYTHLLFLGIPEHHRG